MHFSTEAAIVDLLKKHVSVVSKTAGDNMTLNRMWPLLELLGNPQDKLRAVHVAGTSGKTSTCYFISHILVSAGKSVGLTVSPHVDSIRERIQLDGVPITEEKFCNYFSKFYSLVGESAEHISYFELLVAFELWVFVKEQVDYAVVETGMGGLLDATNVLRAQDKLCVITTIGLDHTHILGDTLGQIASQKAGIIHEHNLVFIAQQSSEIMSPIKQRVSAKNAKLTILREDNHTLIAKNLQLARYQRQNLELAEAVCGSIAERDGFKVPRDIDFNDILIPGRMETVPLKDGSVLIMDGAHNQQKMHAFVTSFQARYQGKKAAVLLALKKGKEYPEVIDELAQIVESLILTTFNTSQDLPAVSQDPEIIAQYARKTHNLEVAIIADPIVAATTLLESSVDMKVITGSFYLLGQARVMFQH